MHATAEALMAALQAQVRTGRLIQAVQLSLDSPCPGWSVRDVLAHTWDAAIAAGVTLDCPDELWDAGLDAARAVIGPGRDTRQYAAEILVSPASTARQRFLAFTGRQEPR
jgi:hypothetical protein